MNAETKEKIHEARRQITELTKQQESIFDVLIMNLELTQRQEDLLFDFTHNWNTEAISLEDFMEIYKEEF